jgi:hypothetical protein
MRKSYVTIEDMGTERQNAGYVPSGSRTDGLPRTSPSPPTKRTSIADIESFASISDPMYSHESDIVKGPIGGVRNTRTSIDQFPEPKGEVRPVKYAPRAFVQTSGDFTPRITCTDVAEHVSSCPVCSRLYIQDPLVYYMIIAVLVIVIAMLLLRHYKD